MTWNRPHHLSADEAQTWTRDEVRRLARAHGVRSIALTRVIASVRYGQPWDWACELHLEDDADPDDCLRDPLCADWLHDLRVLDMHPVVAILAVTEPVR